MKCMMAPKLFAHHESGDLEALILYGVVTSGTGFGIANAALMNSTSDNLNVLVYLVYLRSNCQGKSLTVCSTLGVIFQITGATFRT